MHWADVLAKETAPKADRHVLATAITPSGPIHVGNMREVLTTEMVARSLRDVEGAKAELIYIADTYDPLRKVYTFLDANKYQEHVGRPLAEVPCPCGDHTSYAQHFLEPFLAAVEQLGVDVRVLDAYAMYNAGRYKAEIEEALGSTPTIHAIMEDVSKRSLQADWIPFNVQCESCRRLNGTRPKRLDQTMVEYSCACGHHGTLDVMKPGAGKLPWRVDWPARWRFLGVTFEAMGKDHAASGGSWDTGVRIAREVFAIEPPTRTVYEFIQLKGIGAMHSSTGTGVAAQDVLAMTPPEVMRFFIARNNPSKHLDFDPGLGILDLVDEYDQWERVYHGTDEAQTGMKDAERTYELSQPRATPKSLPFQVSYRHLATVAQIGQTYEEVLGILARGGMDTATMDEQAQRRLRHRVEHVRFWLENFAPDNVKFVLKREPPAVEFTPEERTILARLAKALDGAEWDAEAIHNAVHEAATVDGAKPGAAFRAVYKAFLGQTSGPRAGFFLASLDEEFVLTRLRQAAGGA